MVPEALDGFAEAAFNNDLRLHAAPDALQGTPKHSEGGLAQQRRRLPKIAREAQEAQKEDIE